jgi:hypothetical protein
MQIFAYTQTHKNTDEQMCRHINAYMHRFTDTQTHFAHMIDIPDLQIHGFIDSQVQKRKDTHIQWIYRCTLGTQIHRQIDTQMKMYEDTEITRCSGTRSVTQMHKHIDAHCTDSQIHRCSHILIVDT